MSLTHLMSREVTSLPVSAPVLDAAKFMADMNVGSVVIVEDGNRPVGILTDRDITTKVVAGDKDPHTMKVREIMSSPIVTIPDDKDVIDATRLMCSHKIRRFPVVDAKGKLIGVLSLDDILMFLGQEMQDIATGLKCELGK